MLCILLLVGCSYLIAPTPPNLPPAPTSDSVHERLTQEQLLTLSSLKQVDPYPLYTMTYVGTYRPRTVNLDIEKPTARNESLPVWACSLFTVLLDEENMLYGRNFDWQFSPALLLFTDPPDGYASVSMVDIEYLGYDDMSSRNLLDLPVEQRTDLLDAPYLPFDGMNEYGLAIGMAAVPSGNMQSDPKKETIGSLGIIREMLDHARNVDEAVEIIESYNIDFAGGPRIHYLMADIKGMSVLVEYHNGEMQVIENEESWHLATNFLRSSVDDPADGDCWRYNTISTILAETNGQINSQAAMQLLTNVAQDNTQWSVVYQMSAGTVDIVMGQQYQNLYQFRLDLVDE